MYGLLLEAVALFIKKTYGIDQWTAIQREAKLEGTEGFGIHEIYSENLIPKIVDVASQQLNISKEDLLIRFGADFVDFVEQYGYERILRVLGRHFRDFLNGLDNLHEYLRFGYSKIKPPSFFVEKETMHGLVLHYRSRRRYSGYINYVCGQLKAVAKKFYRKDIDIEVLSHNVIGSRVHVIFDIQFDNEEFLKISAASKSFVIDRSLLRVKSDLFFQMFPFHIVFDSEMVIKHVGSGLYAVKPDIIGYDVTHVFTLLKPMIDFTWDQLIIHVNNAFELKTIDRVLRKAGVTDRDAAGGGDSDLDQGSSVHGSKLSNATTAVEDSDSEDSDTIQGVHLHLKGQMKPMSNWDCFCFLGTLVMTDLSVLFKAGLYLNDLSMHDSSRDLLLAGTQQSAELKLALDQEQQKSQILEDSMKRLDDERRRAAELLYQMIPRQIADQLRNGVPAEDTWQVFSSVSILFSDMYQFVNICESLTPLEVVSLLNAMYVSFDRKTEEHNVYKVETVNDSYMIVAGAPVPDSQHCSRICDMALSMLADIQNVINPSTGKHVTIRVGIHSGTIVGGVVGLRTPRFCLFGDPVNTASRMQSSGEPMKIHASEATAENLDSNIYQIIERGTIDVKGKGSMKTYWILGKSA
ncbi:soluble guanylate cyclase 88E-like [Paramacrobiotus metropolitanus]|uniref:soluble guanylate cyclase 88E-like n=1 Tax=Paramacrobiotus metropolitanus TaxID=2943436 RepID=UPI0024465989|nr:soluble guanylate cyclase 88E-like [Paramacrobiotus metropolitanus]